MYCHLAVLFSQLKVTTMKEVRVYSEGRQDSEQPFMLQEVVSNMAFKGCLGHLVDQLMMQEIPPNTYYTTGLQPPGSGEGRPRVPAHDSCGPKSCGLRGVWL